MGRNVIEILIKADDKASARFKALAANSKTMGDAFNQAATIAGAAGAAILGSTAALIVKTAEWADGLHDVAQRLGTSTEFLSQMEYALQVTGGEIETFQVGLRMLSVHLQDALRKGGDSKKMFDRLGISVTDSSGKIRSADQVFLDLADKIAKAKTNTEAMALAQDLFGRGAMSMIPLLKLGSAGIKELMEKADKLGGTLSTVAAVKADEFSDRLVDVKTSLRGVGLELFDMYGDKLIKFSDKIATDTLPRIREWIAANENLAKGIGTGAGVAIGLGALGKMGVLGPIAAVVAANPLIAAMSIAAGALFNFLKQVNESKATDRLALIFRFLFQDVRKGAPTLEQVLKGIPPALVDIAEDGDAAYDSWERYKQSLSGGAKEVTRSFAEWKKGMQAIYAMYSAPEWETMALLPSVEAGKGITLGGAEAAPGVVNPYADAWNAGLDEFNVHGMDVARDLTSTFGGMFGAIAQKGASAADVFEQAWRSALGNIISMLAQMFLWKIGGEFVTTAIAGVTGGGGGELMQSSTPSGLRKSSQAPMGISPNTVVVNPLFFSGSRQDSAAAAGYIQRQLDSNKGFIIEGRL